MAASSSELLHGRFLIGRFVGKSAQNDLRLIGGHGIDFVTWR